jgi:alpha-tubulin suppressor-like RCC1 family protein
MDNCDKLATGNNHTVAIKKDGTLWAWGVNTYGQLGLNDTTHRHLPVQVGNMNNWRKVACGRHHTIAIRS